MEGGYGTLSQTARLPTTWARTAGHGRGHGGNWLGVTFPTRSTFPGKGALRFDIGPVRRATSRAIATKVGRGCVVPVRLRLG